MTADAVGGVWTYALDLSRALGHRGVRVSMAVMGPPPSTAQRRDAEEIPGLELLHHPYRLEWMDDPWDDVEAAGSWLLGIADRCRPDLVHLNGYAHAALPWKSPVVVVGHSCVLSWWQAVRGEQAPPQWDRYAAVVRRGLAAADLVVAPTAAMLNALADHYGVPARSQVIANGRSLRAVEPGSGQQASSSRQKEPLILTAGRLWDDAKNIVAVCAVAPSLPWPVYVAGDGNVTGTNVHHLGFLSSGELSAWMRRASIFVLPARYEPFGLTAVEAALAGCALVLGDIPSLREVWGDAAMFVPADSHAALTAALEALVADAPRRLAMGERACARARELTAERMADRYIEAYQTCDHRSLHALTAV